MLSPRDSAKPRAETGRGDGERLPVAPPVAPPRRWGAKASQGCWKVRGRADRISSSSPTGSPLGPLQAALPLSRRLCLEVGGHVHGRGGMSMELCVLDGDAPGPRPSPAAWAWVGAVGCVGGRAVRALGLSLLCACGWVCVCVCVCVCACARVCGCARVEVHVPMLGAMIRAGDGRDVRESRPAMCGVDGERAGGWRVGT